MEENLNQVEPSKYRNFFGIEYLRWCKISAIQNSDDGYSKSNVRAGHLVQELGI